MDEPVIVRWGDSWADHSETSPSDWTITEYMTLSVGWIVRDLPTVISLAAERLPDGQFRCVTHIPREMVREILRAKVPKAGGRGSASG